MKSIFVESIGALTGTGGFWPGPPLIKLQTVMSERWFLLAVTVSLLGLGPELKMRQVFTVVGASTRGIQRPALAAGAMWHPWNL